MSGGLRIYKRVLRKWLIFTLILSPVHGFCEDPLQVPTVILQEAKRTALFDVLSFPARIVPLVQAVVLSDIDGVLDRIHTPLGKRVVKGQLLCVLRNPDPVYQFAPSRVTSPVSGIVSSIEVTEGSRVTRGQRLIMVTEPKNVKVVIEVPTSDLADIRVGLRGNFQTPPNSTEYSVTVTGVSPVADPFTGTATAELKFTDKSSVAPVGQHGRIGFKVREHPGIEVPDIAIVYRGNDPHIRVLKEGKAHYQPVTLGRIRRGMVEILKGIDSGEQMIVRSNQFVAPGEKVVVKTDEADKS